MGITCTIIIIGAVIYVTADLLVSAYVVRRMGGVRATIEAIKENIRR